MSFSLEVTVANGIKYFLLKGLGWKRVRTQPKEEATDGAHYIELVLNLAPSRTRYFLHPAESDNDAPKKLRLELVNLIS